MGLTFPVSYPLASKTIKRLNFNEKYEAELKLLRVQYLHYKPVLNHFSKGGGEVRELFYSLREVPFSHGAFLRHNGARERSIIQLTDLLSHWLSLRIITGTDSSRKQFLDM